MVPRGYDACRGLSRHADAARLREETVSDTPRGFWGAARAEPDRIAVVDADERQWTAGEVLAGANRIVHALRARGVRTGDVVATLTRNRAELLQTLLAVFQAGWQYVPINTHLTAEEVAYIVDDCDAQVIIVSATLRDTAVELVDKMPNVKIRLAVGGHIDGYDDYEAALARYPAAAAALSVAGLSETPASAKVAMPV